MATQTIILSESYKNELFHESDFSGVGATTKYPLGPVGTRQQVTFRARISNKYTLGRYDITGGDTITLQSGSFLLENFYEGGRANLVQINTTDNYSFDIDDISSDGKIMVVSNVRIIDNTGADTGAGVLPNGPYGTGSDRDIMRSLSESGGLLYKTAFIPNGADTDFASILDGKIQAYRFEDLRPGGAPGPVVDGQWNNVIKGSNSGSATCQFIQDITDGGVNKAGGSGGNGACPLPSIQEFEIVEEFVLGPEYASGEATNVEQLSTPARLIDGLKQIWELDFRTSLSNPNALEQGSQTHVNGNTTYYNEPYANQQLTEYAVTDISYLDLDSNQEVSQIVASSTTRVSVSITSSNNSFLASDAVVLQHSYLPNADQYANRQETYQEVWLYETLRQLIDDPAANGTIITNFTADLISAGQIDLLFDISFTVDQQLLIQSGYNYRLSIELADSSLALESSNWVNLLIDFNQYDINTDIAGLASFPQSWFYTEPMMFPVAEVNRFSSVRLWNQDGYLYDWYMDIDLNEGAVIRGLALRFVAFNTLTNNWFEFDSATIDLSGQVIANGIQEIDVDVPTGRGYKLADGDKMNFLKMQTGGNVGGIQSYTGQFAGRVSWQDWLSLPSADTIFFDNSLPNKGRNKKASRYSLQNDYVFGVLIDARIEKDGIITQYINRSAVMEIYDFDEQDGSPITWTVVSKQILDLQGNDLNGQIPNNQDSIAKCVLSPDIVVPDTSIYRAEVMIEPFENPSDNDDRLSSIYEPPNDNILIGPDVATLAKIELESGDVAITAKILASQLDPSVSKWNVTWRLGLIDQSVPVVPTVEISIDGNTRQNDGDFVVFQQQENMSSASFVDNLFSLSEGVPPLPSTGWLFKVSPSSLEPGGDATVKANWDTFVPTYIEFSALATVLAANSDRWVYVEANDSTKIDEGFEIKYQKAQVGQNSSVIVKGFASGGIDQDGVLYFDDPVTFNSIALSSGTGDLWLKIQMTTAALEDWTDLGLFGTDITLASLNAITSAYPDGTKWALHYGVTDELLETNSATVTFNFDYNHSTDDKEKSINVAQSDISGGWRSDLVDCIDWKQVPAVNLSSQTDATDAALLSALDWSNPVTVVAWIQLRENGLSSSLNNMILTPLQAGLSNTDGAGMSFAIRQSNVFAQLNVAGQASGASARKTLRWTIPSNMSNDRRCMVVFTYDGGQDITTGHEFYYNGIKCRNADKSILFNNALSGSVQPSTGIYHHGILQAGTGIQNNPSKTERIEVYDKELNAQEIRTLFNYPDAGRDAVVSNLLRSWDYGNVTGANVPDTQASGKDMTIISSGSLPTNVSFY